MDFAEARMYENRHGRFTAVDPLLASGKSANPQTFNRYAYVLGNPIKLTDPTGLQVGCNPQVTGNCQVTTSASELSFLRQPQPGDILGTQWADITRNYDSYGSVRSIEQSLIFQPTSLDERIVQAENASFVFRYLTPRSLTGYLVSQNQEERTTTSINFGMDVGNFIRFGAITQSAFNAGSYPSSGSVVTNRSTSTIGQPSSTFRFSQGTASPSFSKRGIFAGKTIGQLSGELRANAITPNQVPVRFIERDGVNLLVDTRSSLALMRANVPFNRWNLINVTGSPSMQRDINSRLMENKLPSWGSSTIRITGGGKKFSILD